MPFRVPSTRQFFGIVNKIIKVFGIWPSDSNPRNLSYRYTTTCYKECAHKPMYCKVGCNLKHLEIVQVFFSMELVKLTMFHTLNKYKLLIVSRARRGKMRQKGQMRVRFPSISLVTLIYLFGILCLDVYFCFWEFWDLLQIFFFLEHWLLESRQLFFF